MNLESIQKASQEAVERIVRQDAAGHRAAAAALPGPLKEAFALAQGIPVGPWTVRPFYDIDFEFLAALDHPLSKMYRDALRGADTTAMFIPSGYPMWEAAWVMTRDQDEVELMLSSPTGAQEMRNAAKKEFGRQPAKALGELFKAIMRQVEIGSSTTVQFENEPEQVEGEAAKAKENPTLSPLQQTG